MFLERINAETGSPPPRVGGKKPCRWSDDAIQDNRLHMVWIQTNEKPKERHVMM